jgi:arylsulfatase A-like enzyme
MKQGLVYGATDDLGFHIVENPVHVHDLQATILHLLGLDHERLTYKYAGRDFPPDRRAWAGGDRSAGLTWSGRPTSLITYYTRASNDFASGAVAFSTSTWNNRSGSGV